MPVEDLFSRFSPYVGVGFSISAEAVVEVLEMCFREYGRPQIIRTDQGAEFRSRRFERFLKGQRVRHEFIEKGSPWQNGEIESFIGRLGDECFSRESFDNLLEAREVINAFREFYNTKRPHSGLNGRIPCDVYFRKSYK